MHGGFFRGLSSSGLTLVVESFVALRLYEAVDAAQCLGTDGSICAGRQLCAASCVMAGSENSFLPTLPGLHVPRTTFFFGNVIEITSCVRAFFINLHTFVSLNAYRCGLGEIASV